MFYFDNVRALKLCETNLHRHFINKFKQYIESKNKIKSTIDSLIEMKKKNNKFDDLITRTITILIAIGNLSANKSDVPLEIQNGIC